MNRLDMTKRKQVISALVEGNSIRATCRMTDVAKGTVLKLLADVGRACAKYQDEHLRNLACKRIQCDEIWSLRDSNFGNYSALAIADEYFTDGMFGPRKEYYDYSLDAFWLLSEKSSWLPTKIHRVLLKGASEWIRWTWGGLGAINKGGDWDSNGNLYDALMKFANDGQKLVWDSEMRDDLSHMILYSKELLDLPDTDQYLCDQFIKAKFADNYMDFERRRRMRQNR